MRGRTANGSFAERCGKCHTQTHTHARTTAIPLVPGGTQQTTDWHSVRARVPTDKYHHYNILGVNYTATNILITTITHNGVRRARDASLPSFSATTGSLRLLPCICCTLFAVQTARPVRHAGMHARMHARTTSSSSSSSGVCV